MQLGERFLALKPIGILGLAFEKPHRRIVAPEQLVEVSGPLKVFESSQHAILTRFDSERRESVPGICLVSVLPIARSFPKGVHTDVSKAISDRDYACCSCERVSGVEYLAREDQIAGLEELRPCSNQEQRPLVTTFILRALAVPIDQSAVVPSGGAPPVDRTMNLD